MTVLNAYQSNRRTLLKAGVVAAFLLSSTALVTPLLAQPGGGSTDAPFDFETLCARMAAKAQEDFSYPQSAVPQGLAGLGYDDYRLIQFRNERTRWGNARVGYGLQAFHLGWLYELPVTIHAVSDGRVRAFDFSAQDFVYRDAALREWSEQADFPGVAGLRISHPMQGQSDYTEVASYVGSSYFRALGRDNVYGLSARGIAVNTWSETPEEFPRFTEFYLEEPEAGGPLIVYAALEGASLTGAYKFVIEPASPERQETVMEVTTRLYFRTDIAEIGIAPLTSMFLFAQNNRADFNDYRPQVHDSNGLLVERRSGEVLWRPLSNTQNLGNSYLGETNPRAFGLYQRDRDFSAYQDAGARYDKRPSARVEPLGDWGSGLVRLIEIPARLEADDNIVAFWIPNERARAGETLEFSYRLTWGDLAPDRQDRLAHVVETRSGRGGVAGVAGPETVRKFVVDFAGETLDTLPAGTSIDLFTSANGGRIVNSTLSALPEHGVWRAVFDVEAAEAIPVELKAYLVGAGRVLTETWLYQWRPRA